MAIEQVVVITGASAGVGHALARRFARSGASVALLARKATGLAAAARELRALGVRTLAIRVDVTDPEAVEAAAEQIERELGPIDIWVNNAMVTAFGRSTDVRPEELRRVIDVTYHGAVWGTKAALRRMSARGRGTIVQVGLALAYRAIPLQAAYCAAKQALRAFTDSLRVELMHDRIGVHLTMVHLPAVNTMQFGWSRRSMLRQAQPVPPIVQPEIIAESIHWAAHAQRREVYVGWPASKAIVGNELAPRIVDRHLAQSGVDFGAHGIFDARVRSDARMARFVAVTATTVLLLAGVAIYLLS